MELKIYDYDYYSKDLAAHRAYDCLKNKFENIEGMWLYREPEMRTEGNEYPTFTIISPELGLIFIKAYEYSSEVLSRVENKYWTINGQKVVSECLRFRNYVHRITSKIEDPLIELEKDFDGVKIYYFFPYINQRTLLDNIGLTSNEKIFCADDDIVLEQQSSHLSDHDYRSLVSRGTCAKYC